MSEYTWRELERADMDTAAAHAFDMEYRAEQIAREVQKRLARMEHIVDGLGEVKGEIVRCRDCMFYHPREGAILNCRFEHPSMPNTVEWCIAEPDGFCAWGERCG